MYRILTSLTNEHDLRLVALAVLICSATVFFSFKTYGHARDGRDTRRHLWLILAGILSASGMWATHFVALIAYSPGYAIGFDAARTAASLAVAIVAATAGFWIAANGPRLLAGDAAGRKVVGKWISARAVSRGVGGLVIGLGIAGMHFTGMSAVLVAGAIEWDTPFVVLSIAFGVTMSAIALVALRKVESSDDIWIASAYMITAVCGLHFIAMGAVTIVPDPATAAAPSPVDKIVMAVAIVGATAFVIGAGFVAMVIENLKSDLAAYVARLEDAHKEVTNLNVELAGSLEKLREAQVEIVKRGKLAQLGQLTATVAHEIRNPLGAVKTAAYVLERVLKDKNLGIDTHIMRINNGINRCDGIISELLDFARTRKPVLKPIEIADWVRHAVADEAKALPPVVTVEFRADLPQGTVASFDADRMRRVLINLLSNASEAMVGKGRDIPASGPADPRIVITVRRIGDDIEIEAKDNGPGISEENLSRILEPLFTTKSFGVGLGLPAVQKILEQHGGTLSVASRPGEGAVFTARFPVMPPAIEPALKAA